MSNVQEALTAAIELIQCFEAKLTNSQTAHSLPSEKVKRKLRDAISEIDKCEPVCNVEGTWLWIRLMDYCKNKHIAPATQNELFAIAGEAHEVYTSPRPREWVYLSDIDKAECASHTSKLGVLGAVNATEAKCKQLNTKG